MPKKGKPIVIPPEVYEARDPERSPRAELIAQIYAYDWTTEKGRTDARLDTARAMLEGHIGPAEGAVLHQMIQAQQKDAAAGAGRRTVAVRFATIQTREQADAYREAQTLKELQ